MKAIEEILSPTNWEYTSPKENLFSSDDVINAYLKGKNDGLEQQQRLVLEKLNSNIIKAEKHTAETLAYLREKKLNPVSAYLRINSWDDFSILIVLPQTEFLDKKILKVYDFLSNLENEVMEEMYNIQFTICDTEEDEDVDENHIRSDGYILKRKMSK